MLCVEASVREGLEECGLVVEPSHLTEAGHIEFEFKGDPIKLEVHVFQVKEKTLNFSQINQKFYCVDFFFRRGPSPARL